MQALAFKHRKNERTRVRVKKAKASDNVILKRSERRILHCRFVRSFQFAQADIESLAQ